MTLHLAGTTFAAALGVCAAFVSTGEVEAATIRVSQESAAGAGDFDANVLGVIDAYDAAGGATPLSLAAFYQYGGPNRDSYNGGAAGGPGSVSDGAQLFFVAATDGLHFVTVHDSPKDGSGGAASMRWTLAGGAGGAAAFTLYDDDGDGRGVSDVGADRVFATAHMWWDCCADGFAIGALPDAFRLIGGFTEAPTGITRIQAADAAGRGDIALVLDPGRRTRFEITVIATPVPATLPLAATAIAVLATLRGRRPRSG